MTLKPLAIGWHRLFKLFNKKTIEKTPDTNLSGEKDTAQESSTIEITLSSKWKNHSLSHRIEEFRQEHFGSIFCINKALTGKKDTALATISNRIKSSEAEITQETFEGITAPYKTKLSEPRYTPFWQKAENPTASEETLTTSMQFLTSLSPTPTAA